MTSSDEMEALAFVADKNNEEDEPNTSQLKVLGIVMIERSESVSAGLLPEMKGVGGNPTGRSFGKCG